MLTKDQNKLENIEHLEERHQDGSITWLPDLLYSEGCFRPGLGLVCDAAGLVLGMVPAHQAEGKIWQLKNRALLPGLINAHSHAFQRVIRGRTEYRTSQNDSFWTWRDKMYAAAERLSPGDLYDASRMAFLEMVLGGITAVGEFHYLHHSPDGTPYDDPNLLSLQVVRAARDVGLRICLLRVAYARAGYNQPTNPQQKRFLESDPTRFIENSARLKNQLCSLDAGFAWVGVAPHSIRAVPLDYLVEVNAWAQEQQLPVHMHLAEQKAEIAASFGEYNCTPLQMLQEQGLLSDRFTAVHAIHLHNADMKALAQTRAGVCACPITEGNLGDGVVPADDLAQLGVPICLGTDSQIEIDLLRDARALEYHLRLHHQKRVILAPQQIQQLQDNDLAAQAIDLSEVARQLFTSATKVGANSLGFSGGALRIGAPADFFTVALDDPSIAGSAIDDLLPLIVFSLQRGAIREVAVGGKLIVEDRHHRKQEEIVENFALLQRKLWQQPKLNE
jgi:formimidoylglutamate deiminase